MIEDEESYVSSAEEVQADDDEWLLISDLLDRIEARLFRINAKLDQVRIQTNAPSREVWIGRYIRR
jgi:hypothetical protein